MAFVKLDCGILDSSLWVDHDARNLFVTALLMARPHEVREPLKTVKIGSTDADDFVLPPGWYGLVSAASTGIIHRTGIERKAGMEAMERLCAPDADSRTPDFDGRRMVRVDGGFIVLNFDKYRQKDHTAAERARRYRAKKAEEDSVTRDVTLECVTDRCVTQAECRVQSAESINTVPVSDKPKTSRVKVVLTDDAFLESLKADPTYRGVNVELEAGKSRRWCETNNRQPTRKFFVNWLNKAVTDRPMQTRVTDAKPHRPY